VGVGHRKSNTTGRPGLDLDAFALSWELRPQKVDDVDAVRLQRWQNALERALDHGGFAGERGKGFVKLLDRRRIDLEPRQIRVTELAKPLEVRSGVASGPGTAESGDTSGLQNSCMRSTIAGFLAT
jgi:hypothetical protein